MKLILRWTMPLVLLCFAVQTARPPVVRAEEHPAGVTEQPVAAPAVAPTAEAAPADQPKKEEAVPPAATPAAAPVAAPAPKETTEPKEKPEGDDTPQGKQKPAIEGDGEQSGTEGGAAAVWHDISDKKTDPSFDLNYQPNDKEVFDKNTVWYKHWAFWTVVGGLVFAGTMVGIAYSQASPQDSLTIRTSRRP